MDGIEQAVIAALLDALRAKKFISESVCSGAKNLVYAAGALPGFFGNPAWEGKGESDGSA